MMSVQLVQTRRSSQIATALLYKTLATAVACQRPEDNKKPKSQQWKNFLRDWRILMKHIFSPEEEERLLSCCEPSKREALQACVDKAGLTFDQYEQLKQAVKKWRSGRGRNGHSSPRSEEEDLSKIAGSQSSEQEIADKARILGKCVVKIQ
ncbi:hypothetical protein MRX96_054268 [Rhipicephalus microplus]